MSPNDIAKLANEVGFKGADLVRAVAVAMAESSGNPNARNTSGGNDARGLMQINVASRANPQYASRNLYDPRVNLQTAFEMQQRSGWQPWTASIAGQALWTPVATAAAAKVGVQSAPENAANSVGNAVAPGLTDLGQAASKVGGWITTPANWLRVVYVIVGALLVVEGFNVITARYIEPITNVAKTAVKYAK